MHAHLKNRPSAAGSKALKDCVDDMDPTDESSGIVWQLEEMRFKPTGDAVQDMRARQTMQIRINFFYKNLDGTVNYQKKDDDKNIAQMINSVTDEQLFQDLRQKLIDDNPAVKNSRSLDRYIRKQRIGVTSLVSPSENMAMMMQQLHDGENDDVEPMRDVPALVEQAQAAIRERVVRCAACQSCNDPDDILDPAEPVDQGGPPHQGGLRNQGGHEPPAARRGITQFFQPAAPSATDGLSQAPAPSSSTPKLPDPPAVPDGRYVLGVQIPASWNTGI